VEYRPVVSDENSFLYCVEKERIVEKALPHRVVWGMVYAPSRKVWLVQWRRVDKEVCPGLWDMSCAGHVLCLRGKPENGWQAYQRELREELGIESELFVLEELVKVWPGEGGAFSAALGWAKEYHRYPTRDGKYRLEREHVQMFLSLYEGEVHLGPQSEPQAFAWLTTSQVQELIRFGRATLGLAKMLVRCSYVLWKLGLGEYGPLALCR